MVFHLFCQGIPDRYREFPCPLRKVSVLAFPKKLFWVVLFAAILLAFGFSFQQAAEGFLFQEILFLLRVFSQEGCPFLQYIHPQTRD